MVDDIEQIWQEYHDRLLGFITKRVNDHAAAEDILQDVFIKIYSRIDTLKDTGKLQSWMYQITRNAIVDYYRSHKIMHELPEELIDIREDSSTDQAREELYIVSPFGPKHETVVLGESLVEFFRSAGIELHSTVNEFEFTTRKQDDVGAESLAI